MKRFYIIPSILFFVIQFGHSQTEMNQFVHQHFNELPENSPLTSTDLAEWEITNIIPSLNPDVKHVYIQQKYKGVAIQGATYKLNLKNGKITWHYDHFIPQLDSKVVSGVASVTPEMAIANSARYHGWQTPNLSHKRQLDDWLIYDDPDVSDQPISVQPLYVFVEDQLRLIWNVSVLLRDKSHWWMDSVDAATGEIIRSDDKIISCQFGADAAAASNFLNKTPFYGPLTEENSKPLDEVYSSMVYDAIYYVYKSPIESPYVGSQTNVVDPHDDDASPFGWHDTNGASGNEYPYTRGNNVWVKEDLDGNDTGDVHTGGPGDSPHGSQTGGLIFNFPHNENGPYNSQANMDASIVNVFYWANLVHDVTYHYGFDEPSGNFQETHYNNALGAAGDFLYVDVLDRFFYPTGPRARFIPAIDGASPSMEFYDTSTVNHALDNLAAVHEYAHGISTRLVGGSGNIDFPSVSQEQMGEGWSDWLGLMFTIEPGDSGTDSRPVGQYIYGQGPNGPGALDRPTHYSTDTSINGTTYDDVQNLAFNHGVGYAWATILWDLSWALMDELGYDENLHTGNGGNNRAMALIIEGMKNTPINMGFVSGRDAILQADEDLYDGRYSCLIWKVFAARGVGVNAVENNNGGSNDLNDQTSSFDTPCITEDCNDPESLPYSEGFETSIGLWTQDSNDDLDWIRDSLGTPSANTGPSTGANSVWYMYVEATGSGTPHKVANLISPCLDLSNQANVSFSFDYHMKGTNPLGRLDLDVSTNGGLSWENIWGLRGHQGNNWINQTLSLDNFIDDTIQVRFRRTTHTSEIADVAIDNINITSTTPPTPEYCELIPINYGLNPYIYINRVEIGSINNTSGFTPISYQDFTAMSTSLSPLFNTLKINAINPLGTDVHPTAYIDWNADGDFDDPSENLNFPSGTSGNDITLNFGLPSNAVSGPTRMRLFANNIFGPCGRRNTGLYFEEAEEYTVIIPNGFVNVPLLTEKFGASATFRLFPNPVNDDQLNIQIFGVKPETYQIYNLMGQRVMSDHFNNTIDVSKLANGLYLIEISTDDQKLVGKFVKN